MSDAENEIRLPDWNSLRNDVDRCMLSDRPRLHRRIGNLKRKGKGDRSLPRELKKITDELSRSLAITDKRRENLPRPIYPEELPIVQKRQDIAEAILHNQVVIVAGETGSGKTTQLPKICMELGRGVAGLIGCTQPRRIAALGVAGRVADELNTEIGEAVGYQIRFDSKVGPATYIKFMTDGILLAETQNDRDLLAYDTLIIDEAHERSLNIDFLLGYLKRLLPQRPELKIIISSATLDVERFSRFFSAAPVVSVEGRTYPVEVRYRPGDEDEPDLPKLIGRAVREIYSESETGDLLVFLSGERDIRDTADYLGRMRLKNTEILPLYGRLTASEQKRIFQPGKERRIVLATNVAETSITVPRVHYVVDSGLARMKRYTHRTQIERLLIEPVSQASAEQRKGRCGRIAPGICIRLYDEAGFVDRPEYTDPEIKRSSLASVILQMMGMNLGGVEDFPFIDPPLPAAIKTGYDELLEVRAIDAEKHLTASGRKMATLPIEPRYARMLMEAFSRGALSEVLTIVSGLSIQDPRERPVDKKEQADQLHNRFLDESSDFVAWLNLWKFIERETSALGSRNQFRKWCKQNFLSHRRLREWRDVREQLADMMKKLGYSESPKPARLDQLHLSLLSGLISRVGKITEDKDYRGARDTRFFIWPGSGLKKRSPKWVFAAELAETSRLFARTVAEIDPRWVEEIAGDLCKRTYRDPHWDERGGMVRIFEQVSVYGLPVVEKRRVHLGPIDPEKAREVMIREGLVREQFTTRCAFYKHNIELVRDVEEKQHKLRRRDVLVDEDSLFRFYDERIPQEIHTAHKLEKWVHLEAKTNPKILMMRREDVELESARGLSSDLFPSEIVVDGLRLNLSYVFDPGSESDGVTCQTPVGILPGLSSERFDWLVPGLLPDKVALLLRSLPRSVRRDINPVPDTAEKCLPLLTNPDGSLCQRLAEALLKTCGVKVSASDFRPDDIPPHLRMNFRIVDAKGNTLTEDRDLEKLKQGFSQAAKKQFVKTPKQEWEEHGIICWDREKLPERLDLSDGHGTVWAYPAFCDSGDSVSLRVFDSATKAELEMIGGLTRLFILTLDGQASHIRKSLPLNKDAQLIYSSLGGSFDELKIDILASAVNHVFLEGRPPIRTSVEFDRRFEQGRGEIYKAAYDLGAKACAAICDYARMDAYLRAAVPPIMKDAIADLRGQLGALIYPGFIRKTPFDSVFNFPRYIMAMAMRLEQLQVSPQKDRTRMNAVLPLWEQYCKRLKKHEKRGIRSGAIQTYRWMIEEFRVSLFAQKLGTPNPISEKRLERQWELVEN